MHFTSNDRKQQTRGFTLIEMLIIAPIVLLAIGAFVSFMVAMTGEVIATRAQNVMAYDTQSALDQIEQDVKQSYAFLANNDFALQSPQGYTDSTGTTSSFENVSPTNGVMLILRSPTTDKNPLDPNRGLVYTNQPTSSCSAGIIVKNQPFTQNIAYFVKNSTLWRRTLIQQGSGTPTLCGTPWQLPSCMPGVSRGSYCKVDDQRILNNIDSLSIKYYTDPSIASEDTVASSTSSTDSDRSTAIATDDTAVITLTAKQTAAGRTINYSGSMQVTKQNATPPSATYTPGFVQQPPSQSVLSGDQNITFTAIPAQDDSTVQWQRSTNAGSTWSDISGSTLTTLTLSSIDLSWNQNQFRQIATYGGNVSTSQPAILTVSTVNWNSLNQMTGVGDWDGDGSNDIAGYTKSNGNVYLYRGKGNGAFYGPTLMGTIQTTVDQFAGIGYTFNSTRAALWWDTTSTNSFVGLANGPTTFDSNNTGCSSCGSGWSSGAITTFAPKLFSGTANPDRLLRRPANDNNPNLFTYHFRNSTMTSDGGMASSGWNSSFPGDRVMGAGDWNGDGNGDIIGINPSGSMTLYNTDGVGGFGASANIGSGWGTVTKALGGWDYNGDGRPDLLGRWSNGNLLFYRNTGGGNVTPASGVDAGHP